MSALKPQAAAPRPDPDQQRAEAWMATRYGPQLGALAGQLDSYAVRRHVRDAYAAGLVDGRRGAPTFDTVDPLDPCNSHIEGPKPNAS